MGSRRLGSCCPRFALNGKVHGSLLCHICRPHPWHREHNRQGVGTPVHWLRRSLTAYNSGSVTPSDAGGSWRIIVAFPLAAYGYAKTTQWACGERNVPVMLGIQLSRCWVIIIDYQAKSVKIVSRIFLISSGTYSNALCNASAWTGVMYIFLNKWYPSGRERPPFRPRTIFIG